MAQKQQRHSDGLWSYYVTSTLETETSGAYYVLRSNQGRRIDLTSIGELFVRKRHAKYVALDRVSKRLWKLLFAREIPEGWRNGGGPDLYNTFRRIRWLPRAAMRSVEGDSSDCVVVVGVSRPKMALGILTIMLISLFLTFHMIYDTAINSLQNNNAVHPRPPVILLSRKLYPSAARRLPQAIIMGVRKCGTRALLEMLYLHPMVQKAAGEVHFFDRDDNYNKGLEWYRMQMPHSYPGQITIEKSPSYFVTPEVPERIRAMNASVKLLLIVREPVTRAISDYTQLRANAATASPVLPTSSSKTFEQLVLHPNGSINEGYRPLAISVYHHYLHRWLEVFTREQILIVNGDLLIEDPVSQIQRIESFLGLEPRIGTHNFYFNETKGFYCLRNETTDRCLRETKGRKHPRVNPKVLSKLRKYFGEHNQKFYDLIGEDLGWPEE